MRKTVPIKEKNNLAATVTSNACTSTENKNEQINVGSYIIVRYHKKYFPGMIVNIEEDEYEVRTMTPLGANLFKWPNPTDQIWYKKKHIMEQIVTPKLKKLGCYECQEMSKY